MWPVSRQATIGSQLKDSKMTDIDTLISDISHRPYDLPIGQWKYYQEWNNVLFFHWTIPFDLLRKCVPSNFTLDTFGGNCYISLVAFTMVKIRPNFLPSLSFLSNFDEINLRTYIDNNNKKGVYFLSIEAGKLISTLVAKALSGLPYVKSNIKRSKKKYYSKNSKRGVYLDTQFEIKKEILNKSELDKWLTERYCLYLVKDDEFYRYDIHHKEWSLKELEIKKLDLSYKIGDLDLSERRPDLAHYSEGVKVISWKRTKE